MAKHSVALLNSVGAYYHVLYIVVAPNIFI